MLNAQTFFRGQQADTVIDVTAGPNAYETNSTLGIEGAPGYVQFSEEIALSDPLTVYYTLSGSARNGIDYTNLSGVVTIPGGFVGSATVDVQPIDPSTLTNPVESVIFTIQPNTNYLINPQASSATLLIESSSVTISINSQGIDAIRPLAPGQPEQNGVFNISSYDYFAAYPTVTVDYQITGTASNGVDYELLTDSITLQYGTNINVVPLAESLPQGTKYVTLTLISTNGYIADSNNYTATIPIYDQTNLVGIDTYGIGIADVGINSNGPPGAPVQDGSFTVLRSEVHGFNAPITVNYSLGGQATNGVDYTTPTNTISFALGQSSFDFPFHPISNWTNASKTVVMTLVPDPSTYLIDSNELINGYDLPSATNFIDNSSTEVTVSFPGQDAVESMSPTNAPQPGYFVVQRSDSRGSNNPISVYYTMGGSAMNGVDYTNLSGVIPFAQDQTTATIYIEPLVDSNYPGDKTVILSLTPETYYYIDTNHPSASLLILDSNILFKTVITGVFPVGAQYDPYFTNLIFSQNGGDFVALGTNITQVGTNAVTNLTSATWANLPTDGDEVYMTIVTNNNASGFTNGTMFFSSYTEIGLLSSNAAVSNMNWGLLTNAVKTNDIFLRGALCMDTTGAFSNNLIVVTSDDPVTPEPKGVWEVDSHANPKFLTNISAALLEGVTVVPTNFGSWSQKIITGDEESTSLYTIDTNGVLTTIDSTKLFRGGIHSESITVVPTNQSLYLCDPNGGGIVKLWKDYFTNYVGDLLIEDGGEDFDAPAKLFIIRWDAASSNFLTWRLRYNYGSGTLEQSTFAPIQLPVH